MEDLKELCKNLQYDYKNKDKNIYFSILTMLNRTSQMFEYKNLPETIRKEKLERYLQLGGICFVTKVNNNLYAFEGGYGGELDEYYEPTIFTVANPYLNFNKSLKIGEDGILCRNDSNKIGLLPIFLKYATLMVENELTLEMGIINSRAMNLISAPDDRTLKGINQYLENLTTGKLAAVGEKQVFEGIKIQPLQTATNGGLTNLIEVEQYLKASWFNEIGINANFNMKREALNSSESSLNTEILFPLIDDMLHCREKFIEKINEMYGTEIEVSLHSVWEHRDEEKNIFIDEEEILEMSQEEIKEETIEEPTEEKEDLENE